MDWQIVGLWVGIIVAFLLGLFNLFWGGGILSRREKVKVIHAVVYADFFKKGSIISRKHHLREGVTLSYDIINIDVACELVLTSGNQELEIQRVSIKLDENTCKGLDKYFGSLRRKEFDIYPVDKDRPISYSNTLVPKKPVGYEGSANLDCTELFEKDFKNKGGSYPDFIQPFLDELETKFRIKYVRYDNKVVSWRFPDKWYRNLGKKIWG